MWQLPPMTPDDILIYLRKSRADDPLLSVDEVLAKHEQMLDEWVERNLPGMGKIPEINRFKEVVSGETLESRPRVQELLRKVESPKYKAILIVEPQRLSRGDLEDIGRLVKLLRYTNTIVITLPYSYDLRDERDRDMFERELKRGNEFLEYQKKIMNNGRLLSVQNGNYIGTKPPYGYRKVMYKEGKKKCYTLEPIPEEAAIVKLIFEMYRDGNGSHKIARHLNSLGVKTQRGAKWSAESLKKMRSNEHYIGKVVWNKRQTTKTVEDGEIIVSRPLKEEYLVYPGRQPAIIDQDLWDDVQKIRNKIPPVKGKAKCANPFAGLVYCHCGRTMSRRTYKDKEGKERNAPRLLCDDQVTCGTPSCTVEEMTIDISKILRDCIIDFDMKIKNEDGNSIVVHQKMIKQLEQRMIELNNLELSQWDKYTQEAMPKHIFDQLNAKVLREKEETQQALCTAKNTLPEPVDYENKKMLYSKALRILHDKNASALEQNLVLKECIDYIEYNREKKAGGNRRWGDPEPLQLQVHLKV